VGLADFGRAEGYLHRQLSRWRKQMAASQTRELPAAERLYELAAAAIPNQQPGTIVHGDFRLDNVLFDDEDRPTAVLDWEMATLGDPLAYLSLMLMYGRVSRTQGADEVSDVTLAALPRPGGIQARGDSRGDPLPAHPRANGGSRPRWAK
jgi:aminoglycoside phosphotransferase (APT) family kinase protein